MMNGNSNNHEPIGRATDNDAQDIYSEQPYTAPQVKNNKRRKSELSDNHEANGRAADNLYSEQQYTAPQVKTSKRRKSELSDNHESYNHEANGMAADNNADDLLSERPYTASQVKNPKRRTKLEHTLRHIHDLRSMTSYREGLVPGPEHSYIFMCEDEIVDEPRKGRENKREEGANYTFSVPETYLSPKKLGTMLVSIGTQMCEDSALNDLECGTNWKISHDIYGFFSHIHGPHVKLPTRTGNKQLNDNRRKRYGRGYV